MGSDHAREHPLTRVEFATWAGIGSAPSGFANVTGVSQLRSVTALEVELGGDVLAYFRREAARRDLTTYQLVRDLLDVIATDALVPAVLDNGGSDPQRAESRQ
jgi:hypothetical protein